MKEQKLRMKDIMGCMEGERPLADTNSEPEVEFAEAVEQKKSNIITVNHLDIEEVVIPEIMDNYGRISDMIDHVIEETGVSVVPFEIAGIAPEIVRLRRHTIFNIGARYYAMSKEPRDKVIEEYTQRIITTLSSGIPFTENISVAMTYNGKVYMTLALSQVEWTIIMSKFRYYKQQLYISGAGDLILEIFAERVKTM